MTTSSNASGNGSAVDSATVELLEIQVQTEAARAELSKLREQVQEAKTELAPDGGTPFLSEVNEQLVLANLRVQAQADGCERALKEVSRTAELDVLTELPNRVLLLDRFSLAMANARRHGTRIALMFLDLNRFKEINDSLGHGVGDAVLKVVAQRLTSSVREADTVSRHGGDEFLILVAEVALPDHAVQIADKIIKALEAPCRVDEYVVRLTASIGISIFPDDGEDVEALIKRADTAMYRAKHHGQGSAVFQADDVPAMAPDAPLRPLTSLSLPFARYEDVLVEHERRHARMQEANEQLVIAAIDAQELRAAADKAARRQAEFLAAVVHELRSPLAPISLAASLLGRANANELPQMQAIIERQVAHMTRLVGDLLDVSRAKAGKMRVEFQTVDLTAILDAAVDACRPAMDLRLQHFRILAPSLSLEVQGDPIRLAQVFCNLLTNASKYTPSGGDIVLSVSLSDSAIVLTVSDNGIGITEAGLPHIFDPFVQDTHAIGFNGSGLGIGLTVVRELVEAHNGTIVVASAGSGQGSQFVVTLPWQGSSAPHTEVPAPGPYASTEMS